MPRLRVDASLPASRPCLILPQIFGAVAKNMGVTDMKTLRFLFDGKVNLKARRRVTHCPRP